MNALVYVSGLTFAFVLVLALAVWDGSVEIFNRLVRSLFNISHIVQFLL
ncbi:hypothetical protein SAMN04488133_0022 [Halobellus limi]|uniref:Uncharacterized protein n=1 Tax=Halobellus limi TaxID=699433 RepID=A0A1H5SN40_9EURY|nr:hypothetical protein SAMN04488133_0022 [Halobellus limi]